MLCDWGQSSYAAEIAAGSESKRWRENRECFINRSTVNMQEIIVIYGVA